ncbi:cupin domain-containing protein [Natronospira bacteriovora]|uniref:Cupin domain-containing protein n=1 Tax=Natronospira bacteriovora TaxID=3069753 RepID=A0ABU0W9R6_9GAMM|nr:cupin domain-containing protein [Natronospira sp. AB-CW4]MDQ2070781.1 cupin domain-containing protein [Natronospira sp. AB-CW4]
MRFKLNLNGLAPAAFLARYWQKKPALFRQAISDFESPLSPDELAGLACEEGVESRLVTGGVDGPWKMREGPFSEADFAALPDRDWTLLVQDVDKHLPDLAGLLDSFDFLPRWRMDDLMISYAAEGGSVGPHVDAYDVFLLQARGQRRWAIDENAADDSRREDSDLDVLRHFKATQEWVLRPGDILYLPPGVPHFGIAGPDCMTFSVGLRAPDTPGMISDFSEFVTQQLPEGSRYADPDLNAEEGGPRLHPKAIDRVRKLLSGLLEADNQQLADWFGRFVTEPKPWLRFEDDDRPADGGELAARLQSGEWPLLRSDVLAIWREGPDGRPHVFVDGDMEVWPDDCKALLDVLLAREETPGKLALNENGRKLMADWLSRGRLEWVNDN